MSVDPSTAELILPVDPDRMEWLKLRRTGIGSSDISALVGLSKYRSPYEVWLDKTGQVPLVDDDPSEAAEMGHLLEPVVRARFARVHDLTVERVGTYRSRKWPWMIADPDGVCSDGFGFEAKTCSIYKAHEWDDGQTADHAELQAQWGMAVTGLQGWHVAVLIGGQRNEYRFVERDDDLIAVLADHSRAFWETNVQGGTAPEWGGSDAATDYLTDRYRLGNVDSIVDISVEERDEIAREREKTKAALDAAVADDNAVKNKVRDLLGEQERLMCGHDEVATWRNTGKFAEKRFREEQPALAEAYTRRVEMRVLDTKALQADHPEVYRAYRARVLNFKI